MRKKPRGCISENRKGNLRTGMQRSLWRLNPPPPRSVQGKLTVAVLNTDFTEAMAGGSPQPPWRQQWQGASCEGWCILCQHITMENLNSSLQNVHKAGCKEGLHLEQSVWSQCKESLYLNLNLYWSFLCCNLFMFIYIWKYLNFLCCWSLLLPVL